MSESPIYTCDLCGTPIQVPNFQVMTRSGFKRFCCEGCEGVYRMLHEGEIVDDNSVSAGLH